MFLGTALCVLLFCLRIKFRALVDDISMASRAAILGTDIQGTALVHIFIAMSKISVGFPQYKSLWYYFQFVVLCKIQI